MSYTAVLWSLATVLIVGVIVIGLVGEPHEGPVFIAGNAALSAAPVRQDVAADARGNVLISRQGRDFAPSQGQQASHLRSVRRAAACITMRMAMAMQG
jgi:hypothetical protein